jgi:hypothetical protein
MSYQLPCKNWAELIFGVLNERTLRQSLEVEIKTINEQPFKGTFPPLEAKYKIFKESLGFEQSNFSVSWMEELPHYDLYSF